MSQAAKCRTCPDDCSNNSSDESFFNDCEACCYEVHHTAPFPHKCVYDDVLQQYKMRLKRAQMELTDKDLLITMLRDQHVKMETYCRNSLDETQNMRTRYISAVQELECLKKLYQMQNEQKTKEVTASNQALEALLRDEVDRWNSENKEILKKIELMDFDIQKLIQLMAEHSRNEEKHDVKPHIERIEKLIANQSAVLGLLTAKVGENASAILVSNQGFGSRMKELMDQADKSHVDLLDEIETLKKKTDSLTENVTRKAYTGLTEKPLKNRQGSNQFFQTHISPIPSIEEGPMEKNHVQPLEKGAPSLVLDAKEDVRISIQIEHAPNSDDISSSSIKRTSNSERPEKETILTNKESQKDYSSGTNGSSRIYNLKAVATQTEFTNDVNDLMEIASREMAFFGAHNIKQYAEEFELSVWSESYDEPIGYQDTRSVVQELPGGVLQSNESHRRNYGDPNGFDLTFFDASKKADESQDLPELVEEVTKSPKCCRQTLSVNEDGKTIPDCCKIEGRKENIENISLSREEPDKKTLNSSAEKIVLLKELQSSATETKKEESFINIHISNVNLSEEISDEESSVCCDAPKNEASEPFVGIAEEIIFIEDFGLTPGRVSIDELTVERNILPVNATEISNSISRQSDRSTELRVCCTTKIAKLEDEEGENQQYQVTDSEKLPDCCKIHSPSDNAPEGLSETIPEKSSELHEVTDKHKDSDEVKQNVEKQKETSPMINIEDDNQQIIPINGTVSPVGSRRERNSDVGLIIEEMIDVQSLAPLSSIHKDDFKETNSDVNKTEEKFLNVHEEGVKNDLDNDYKFTVDKVPECCKDKEKQINEEVASPKIVHELTEHRHRNEEKTEEANTNFLSLKDDVTKGEALEEHHEETIILEQHIRSIFNELNNIMNLIKQEKSFLHKFKDDYRSDHDKLRLENNELLKKYQFNLDALPDFNTLYSTVKEIKIKVNDIENNIKDIKVGADDIITKRRTGECERTQRDINVTQEVFARGLVQLNEKNNLLIGILNLLLRKMTLLEKNVCTCSHTKEKKVICQTKIGCTCKSIASNVNTKQNKGTTTCKEKPVRNTTFTVQTCLHTNVMPFSLTGGFLKPKYKFLLTANASDVEDTKTYEISQRELNNFSKIVMHLARRDITDNLTSRFWPSRDSSSSCITHQIHSQKTVFSEKSSRICSSTLSKSRSKEFFPLSCSKDACIHRHILFEDLMKILWMCTRKKTNRSILIEPKMSEEAQDEDLLNLCDEILFQLSDDDEFVLSLKYFCQNLKEYIKMYKS